MKTCKSFVNNALEDQEKFLETRPKSEASFVKTYLEEREKLIKKEQKDFPLTLPLLKESVLDLFLSSYDTISSTIQWSMLML